jgi:hypothetical protein
MGLEGPLTQYQYDALWDYTMSHYANSTQKVVNAVNAGEGVDFDAAIKLMGTRSDGKPDVRGALDAKLFLNCDYKR